MKVAHVQKSIRNDKLRIRVGFRVIMNVQLAMCKTLLVSKSLSARDAVAQVKNK
jgi:hypothetical protein